MLVRCLSTPGFAALILSVQVILKVQEQGCGEETYSMPATPYVLKVQKIQQVCFNSSQLSSQRFNFALYIFPNSSKPFRGKRVLLCTATLGQCIYQVQLQFCSAPVPDFYCSMWKLTVCCWAGQGLPLCLFG